MITEENINATNIMPKDMASMAGTGPIPNVDVMIKTLLIKRLMSIYLSRQALTAAGSSLNKTLCPNQKPMIVQITFHALAGMFAR